MTPDARQIHARALCPVQDEAMLAYLLVDALSFSMVRLGCEPLHATAVSTGDGVAAFLGNSGDGKSTLAAAFIQGGCRLLTDDMLVVTRHSQGWLAQPGPPRIKLYRDMADNILGAVSGSIPMNAVTDKLIIPLQRSQSMMEPAPLTTLYVLNGDSGTEGATPLVQRLSWPQRQRFRVVSRIPPGTTHRSRRVSRGNSILPPHSCETFRSRRSRIVVTRTNCSPCGMRSSVTCRDRPGRPWPD